ncbi:unnamed protein product [Cuscuta epithymum]|uniref:Uncharacterized protein n=1 Tax=Cuscuta epithymum TaxID=186058 RepID=A0AAV0DFF1_9ASTE|nr:unnamed protein product [Cuscuta epithymum]
MTYMCFFLLTFSQRNLSTFVLEESKILQKDRGEWLHELAVNNSVLENLNFYKTDLWDFRPEDIELIARNCPRLVSMKVSQSDMSSHFGFFRAATALEEFAGGFVHVLGPIGENMQYADFAFPPRLCSLGLTYFRINEMPILFPICSRLRKLDLLYAEFDTQGHCTLLEKCVNLEILEATNVIGDRGLEVLSRFCKKLKRLRIERGGDEDELGMEDEDEQGMEDEEGSLTQRGLVALSQGCLELQYLAVYVSDITNQALRYIGKHLKHLSDFRLVLLDRGERITDFPLDKGVRSLLRGCPSLIRFALYLRSGGLTDKGLNYVGQYSPNVRWMFLGYVGESDEGLLQFSEGCPCLSLQKLEMRGCFFSERALAMASSRMTSLRYLWVEGFNSSSIGSIGQDLLRMARPFWNIGVIPARGGVMDVFGGIEPASIDHSSHMLAYYSLDGRRTDTPETVVCLDRNNMELGG